MKKIAVIGANNFQNALILKAKEMGYETHVFAWKDGSIGEQTADYFYPISVIEKEQILEKCKEIKPNAVVTIASDLANITVQYVASRLGLPCNPDQCISISTNKNEMRKAFVAAGVKSPKFVKVDCDENIEENLEGMTYPLIIKPTDRSGSRGINKVNSIEEVKALVDVSIQESFEKCAIIEEYIEGNEYSCETISYNGRHHVLNITQKYTTGYPHFIETGHLEPADLSKDMFSIVKSEIFKALDALQIHMGASHSEFKIDRNGEVRIIEIGSRMGGDCIGSDLVPLSTGYDFVKMVIQTALGQEPELVAEHGQQCAGIRFLFNQYDFEILSEVREKWPKVLNFVSPIEEIDSHEVVDSSSRFGYFILCSKDKNLIKEIIEK